MTVSRPRSEHEVTSFDPSTSAEDTFQGPAEHDPLADKRVRPLLERWAAASGAQLTEVGDGLLELHVPEEFRPAFRDRERVRIAFTLAALEHDPEAEIAVVGGTLVEQLVTAVRMRGSRAAYGVVTPDIPPTPEAAALGVPVTNGHAEAPQVRVVRERVVRLLARVIVRAGAEVEEHLVESGLRAASTGARVSDAVVTRCIAMTNGAGSLAPAADLQEGGDAPLDCPEADAPLHLLEASEAPLDLQEGGDAPLEPGRPIDELIPLMLDDLRADLDPRVAELRTQAAESLRAELHRIDGYYRTLLEEASGRGAEVADAETRRIYEAEHARRRAEEERRHQVRVIVHPVQLAEWEVLAQHARWELVSNAGHRATLVAQRVLTGTGDWSLACPNCGAASPPSLAVCRESHAACGTCALECGVCAESFCRDHGMRACHVDGRPSCTEHGRTCASCHEPYCTDHEGTCADGGHQVCTGCLAPCAICEQAICTRHATMSTADAPLGARRLCGDCVRYCEGGTSEPVGRDEVARCTSCEHWVCVDHQATCAVDRQVHCSKHLRRTDDSRRLVCEEHRAACAAEPGTVLASDEVVACEACGRSVCTDAHSHECVECRGRFCEADAVALRDRYGEWACREHHAVCHVDSRAYSMAGAERCPVCDRHACRAHLRECDWCGRTVCVAERDEESERCITCRRLSRDDEPSDDVLAAAIGMLGKGRRARSWKTSRDAGHVVVEVALGWRRRVVFAVRHGSRTADVGRNHTLLRSREMKLEP